MSSPVPEYLANLSSLTTLQLSSCGFTDVFPRDVFHIQKLKVLDVSDNQDLGGSLPNFPQHGHLQTLNLSNTNFSGQLPGAISNLKKLSTLDLSNCQFNGTIPTSFSGLPQLVHLDLSFNNFTGLLPSLNMSKNLKYLSLFQNDFTGPITSIHWESLLDLIIINLGDNSLNGKVPSTLFTLPSLQELTLSRNGFDGPLDEFPNASFSTLKMVDLTNNKLQGPIPMSFFHLLSLDYLHLSSNQFNGTIQLDMFQSLQNLHTLGLSHNNLSVDATFNGGRGLSSFPNMTHLFLASCKLRDCQRLEVLNLGNNVLSDIFPCFLGNISTLRVLILRSNKLHGPTGCQHNTGSWDMLHIVDLAWNNFTGTLPRALLQSWRAMMGGKDEAREKSGNLFFDMYDFHHSVRYKDMLATLDKVLVKKLAMLQGTLSRATIENLFSYYVNAYQLQWGGAYLDSVTVVNKGLRMNLVKILAVFTSLDFSSNHFEGPIPEELMSLRALNVLNLSHNTFWSHIPSSLGNLTQIESLDLSSNNLSGEIPTEIASLSFLSVLNLSYNHLVGEIPSGTQIQSLEAGSFEGNEGLCGPPLTKNCNNGKGQGMPIPASETHGSIDWNFLSAELGFIFGFGCVILPLIFWKRWRYNKHVEDLLYRIFPQLDFVYEQHGEQRYRTLRWRPI